MGAPRHAGEGRSPSPRGPRGSPRTRAREVTGPAQQGWGPDGFAGGAGAQPPLYYDARVPLSFVKYHGLGNDFVVVDGPLMDAARARRICDRRRGIGGDGVLTVLPARTAGAAATMHIYNSDGSVAAMCGNGIRCMARHLAERRGLDGAIVIDTDSGPKACTIHRGAGGEVEAVSVEMGPAALQGEQTFRVGGRDACPRCASRWATRTRCCSTSPRVERAAAVGPPRSSGACRAA